MLQAQGAQERRGRGQTSLLQFAQLRDLLLYSSRRHLSRLLACTSDTPKSE
ncbi:hypothetical protein CBOM_02941 [Ceraceosorus bombacis]|uniref:Uncharacterized protein n=1 Tax=Ceraceosorus bombacis TaxID=401625 RepID=A0A0N7L9Z3_9BASI|nr:hypothetical protein CBOM_02941 [Ceraceosorus bombacis]